ncbi:MAG: DNA methyltransferase [Thermoanaerobaculia bacterium]
MPSLHPDLRNRLRSVVLEARRVAEKGAGQALRALAVDAAEPAGALSAEKRKLRVALRARGRQLGDALGRDNRQKLDHLLGECAYEHWHRMLFARFLAENDLLLHPDGVAVTLDEVRAFANEESAGGARIEPWELAARWAARMLPALFRPDDPVLALDLAAEHRTKLEALLAGLPTEIFTADDGLGWVYQFWQEERKDAVNKSEVKIGADELPAVTQLFTEPYMVKFLLHNTLGAWWVGRHGGMPPLEMEFLRRNDDGTPAAGAFDEWPKRAAELKVLDPCCGSGHFLVEALKILVAFRMAEEKLGAGEAVDAVLRDNLFGLEIDPRCTQIAAFAVALTAWKLAEGYRDLPADGVHVACCGIAPRAKKEEWLRLAGGDEKLRNGLERLYDLFKDAPTLGSLIDPTQEEGGLFVAAWGELKPLLAKALAGEKKDEEARELGVAARGIATAAEILAGRYTLVATNVPYLARGKQARCLADFCARSFPDSKTDLATVFVDRLQAVCAHAGTIAVVTPQTWMFLSRYGRLRKRLLLEMSWSAVVWLGPGAFEMISGEVVMNRPGFLGGPNA